MARFVHRNVKRCIHAFAGILYAIRFDTSFKIQFFIGGIFLVVFVFFTWPLSDVEILFLGLSWTLVLITELQNSSFEAALDRIHPERHIDIGKSKDMAAGAVLIAAFFALLVVFMIIAKRIL